MNNRLTLRYSVVLPAVLVVEGRAITCEVGDVSLGGMFLRHAKIETGRRGVLRFACARLVGIALPFIVRWRDERGIGVQLEPNMLDETVLATVIRASRRDPVPG